MSRKENCGEVKYWNIFNKRQLHHGKYILLLCLKVAYKRQLKLSSYVTGTYEGTFFVNYGHDRNMGSKKHSINTFHR